VTLQFSNSEKQRIRFGPQYPNPTIPIRIIFVYPS